MFDPSRLLPMAALGLCALLPAAPAAALTFNYTDFSSVAGLNINGDAAQSGSVLRLVPSTDTQSGTAYYGTPLGLGTGNTFSTAFEFNVTTDRSSALGPPDGFTFLLQSVGPNAVGAGGQGLGYAGLSPSVAVVFRGRAPSFIGVITGGTDPADLPIPFDPPGSTPFAEGAFYEKNEFAFIDYSAGILSVYLSDTSTKPLAPVMTTAVDLSSALGPQSYVGFSAGNGGAFGTQDILSWSFTTDATIPEPPAVLLLAAGLLSLGLYRRGLAR